MNDVGRGTGLFSIKFFFELLFGADEAARYLEFADHLHEVFVECLGMRPIKTLFSYSLFGYRFIIDKHLRNFTLAEDTVFSKDKQKSVTLSSGDVHGITERFSALYRAMVGNRDYAISFITAEWLFDSLKNSGTIDLSPIIMGYCKSVEQLLFQIVKFHTGEGRKIKANQMGNQGSIQHIPFTDEALNNYQVDTTWGSLAHFLEDNPDLLIDSISDDGREYILVRLRQLNSKRNKYFHKENCDDWVYARSLQRYVVYPAQAAKSA